MRRVNSGPRRDRTILLGGLAVLVVVLGVFAYLIASTQAQARRDLERRFRDRAQISAAVAEGVFSAIGGTGAVSPVLTKARPSQADLDRLARQSRNAYIVVRGPGGKVLAATSHTPAAARRALRPELRKALGGAGLGISNVIPGKPPTVQFAIPFKGPDGPRVEIAASPIQAWDQFLGTFLARLPNRSGATAVVVDPTGRVVGSPDKGVTAGPMYPDAKVLAAAKKHPSGDLGSRFYASAPIRGSQWRVASALPDDKLYASINGSRRMIPWLILLVLAIVGLVGILAIRRAAAAQAEVYRRSLSRQTALEINDNVIQRLAVVKFALERGQQANTGEKVAEALEEAQRLVNQLLGEEGTDAGTLRRETSAPADTL
jgi:hypothetical protein